MAPKLKLRLSGKYDYQNAPFIKSAAEAEPLFRKSWKDIGRIETFKVMLLSNALQVIGIVDVSTGGVTSCLCDIRVVMQAALLSNATQIIVAHNHPSGMMRPSDADLNITKQLRRACDALSIKLLDSLIISPVPTVYVSIEE